MPLACSSCAPCACSNCFMTTVAQGAAFRAGTHARGQGPHRLVVVLQLLVLVAVHGVLGLRIRIVLLGLLPFPLAGPACWRLPGRACQLLSPRSLLQRGKAVEHGACARHLPVTDLKMQGRRSAPCQWLSSSCSLVSHHEVVSEALQWSGPARQCSGVGCQHTFCAFGGRLEVVNAGLAFVPPARRAA